MEKFMSFALSVALVFALSATPLPITNAEAASKSHTYKSGKKHIKTSRRSLGGGGCQTLSSSALEQKASQYYDSIDSASSKYGVSKNLIKAVITIESCFKSTARGSLGEKGLMQLMPGTARRFNIRNGYNAWENIHGGARYLGYLLSYYDGNTHRAVAAYNAGEGNVRKGGSIPNQGYVSKVMQAFGKFSSGAEPVYTASAADQQEVEAAAQASKPLIQPMKVVLSHATDKTKPIAKVQKASYVAEKSVVAKSVSGRALPWADMHSGSGNGVASYQVKAGDTVYEVMRQTGVPVKNIIRLNRLPAPYSIQAGQTLRLR